MNMPMICLQAVKKQGTLPIYWTTLSKHYIGHGFPSHRGMESNTFSPKEARNEKNKVMLLPVIILLLLIITFIGLQAYYMFSAIAQPW